jgi:hypothetical protein
MVETAETADGPRRRRLGAGMVRAADGGTLRIGAEVIGPRERLAVDHPLVREHPELFLPVHSDDRACHERMVMLLRAREATLTGRAATVRIRRSTSGGPGPGQAAALSLPPPGAGAGGLNLPPPRRPLRLP